MKNALPYILVLVATFILSAIVVFGTLMLRPDLLKKSATVSPAVDTVKAAPAPKYLREYAGPTPEELQGPKAAGPDSISVYRDSVNALLAKLSAQGAARPTENPVAPVVEPQPVATVAPPAAVVDSAKIKLTKSRAKLLEAMPPEDAAKILSNLTDEETKELLKYVKARQAAKIIASIQPERASKLFR